MYQVQMKETRECFSVGKIICLGRNYLDHIRELGNQIPDRAIIFCKPASSIIPNGGTIEIPSYSNDCHHELELALLIGQSGKALTEQTAMDHIAGYGVALDLTLRDLQTELKTQGLPWELAKGFDSSCPISDFTLSEHVSNPNNLSIKLKVNGEMRQNGNTNQMMRSVEQIVAEVSQYYRLEPGDIILTGTPAGVSRIQSGDILEGEIEQVGSLKVAVA